MTIKANSTPSSELTLRHATARYGTLRHATLRYEVASLLNDALAMPACRRDELRHGPECDEIEGYLDPLFNILRDRSVPRLQSWDGSKAGNLRIVLRQTAGDADR